MNSVVNSDGIIHPKTSRVVAGRYYLDQQLAVGGMGAVFRGHDIDTGARVAVKFLLEEYRGQRDLVGRFEREVAAMRRVKHPHLVRIIDSGVAAGLPYLVMDFHNGKLLSELLAQGRMPPPQAVALVQQVLDGVAAAHKSGVVHRDLKPDNILLLEDARGYSVKILDFGLAKIASERKLTNTGFALGTPWYMAPEQARGAPTDERSDIYSIGVMLYQMVVGRPPFDADSPFAVMRMQVDDAPVPPRKAAPSAGISRELEWAIWRALEKDPAKRWRSAEALTRALAATPEAALPMARPQRRRWAGRALRVAALLAVIGASTFIYQSQPALLNQALATAKGMLQSLASELHYAERM